MKLYWGPRERTCLIPAGPLLSYWPRLEVGSGWVRPFPFRIEAGRLVLELLTADPRYSIPSEQKAEKWRREHRKRT